MSIAKKVTTRYYPKLSELMTLDDLPEFLSFAREGLEEVFDRIYFKNLRYSKSSRGDSAFYQLDILSKEITLLLPFGLRFIINPDQDGAIGVSSFPVTLEYRWEILAFLRNFKLSNFAFTPYAFLELGQRVLRISDAQLLAHALNVFADPLDPATACRSDVRRFG